MRPELLTPVDDSDRLGAAAAIACEIYRLHEAGRDYAARLRELGAVVGRSVAVEEAHGAFGSVAPEAFAEQLLAAGATVPTDLSEAEMLELLDRVRRAEGTEAQLDHWLACLRANTGDERLPDLIFWPGEYFGDGDDSRELTSQDILRTALRNGRPAAG